MKSLHAASDETTQGSSSADSKSTSGPTCARSDAGKEIPFLDPLSTPGETASAGTDSRTVSFPLDRTVPSETSIAVFGMG